MYYDSCVIRGLLRWKYRFFYFLINFVVFEIWILKLFYHIDGYLYKLNLWFARYWRLPVELVHWIACWGLVEDSVSDQVCVFLLVGVIIFKDDEYVGVFYVVFLLICMVCYVGVLLIKLKMSFYSKMMSMLWIW